MNSHLFATIMELAAVLGATGGLGKAVVDSLLAQNIQTKVLVRNPDKFRKMVPAKNAQINIIKGDLDNNQALAQTLEYCDAVFLCFNTPYQYWKTDMVRWISKVADLCASLQARMLFPGNIYNYGQIPKADNPISEEYPQTAHTEKGQLRRAIENRLVRASMEGASLTILRFPDFYGPAVLNDLVTPVFRAALDSNRCRWFGDPDENHDFIYTKDAGKALVLAAVEPKTADTVLHVPGPEVITPREWIDMIYQNANAYLENPIKIIPKWQVFLASLLDQRAREFRELIYLFENPIIMDGSKFEKLVGPFERTSHQDAINETLEWYTNWFSPQSRE